MIVIGIDPGQSGGIAVLRGDPILVTDAQASTGAYAVGVNPRGGYESVEAHAMPETERDIAELLACVALQDVVHPVNAPRVIVYMEAVHAMPPTMPGNTSVASFRFGQNYGFLRGVLVGLKITFVDVSPQKWKKALGLNFTARDSQTDKKNGSKQLAQQWFPQLKITHAVSEALLIAEFGRRQEQGRIK